MTTVYTCTSTDIGPMIFHTQTPRSPLQIEESAPAPASRQPPPPSFDSSAALSSPPTLTLSKFYFERLFDTRKENLSRRTIDSDKLALRNWDRRTNNIDLHSLAWQTQEQTVASLRILRAELQRLVASMRADSICSTSINTTLRTLRTIFRIASDPIDHALIGRVPDLGKQFTGTASAWQLKETRATQRKSISAAEMESLFQATEFTDDPHLWKCILAILWTYGARTEDTFFKLDWSLVNLPERLMQFTANKTSKLQGVPLTPLMVAVLTSLCPRESGPIFGTIQRGSWCQSDGWKPGYYTVWSRDILPAGGFIVKRGPKTHKEQCAAATDARPNLLFHHFRKTMVTELNVYSGQAGNWVAAHYMSGVSEKYYDMPSERIAKAVADRERDRMPQCFKDYFRPA